MGPDVEPDTERAQTWSQTQTSCVGYCSMCLGTVAPSDPPRTPTFHRRRWERSATPDCAPPPPRHRPRQPERSHGAPSLPLLIRVLRLPGRAALPRRSGSAGCAAAAALRPAVRWQRAFFPRSWPLRAFWVPLPSRGSPPNESARVIHRRRGNCIAVGGGAVWRPRDGGRFFALLAVAGCPGFPALHVSALVRISKIDPPLSRRLERCARRGGGAVGRRPVFFMRYRRYGLPRA